MRTETGLKLRSKLEYAHTLSFTNASPTDAFAAGSMTMVNDTVGIVVEPVGVSTSSPCADWPHGPNGVLIYQAERVVVPKATGSRLSFAVGERVYYDANARKVTPLALCTILCGRALASAGDWDTEVEIDLLVLS